MPRLPCCPCRRPGWMLIAILVWFAAGPAALAVILWSDGAARIVHKTPEGVDILGGAVKRDDTASDALYFKFHVNPLSDWTSEEYFAVFHLVLKQTGGLAVGNAPEAWAYSADNAAETGPDNRRPGEFNLRTSHASPCWHEHCPAVRGGPAEPGTNDCLQSAICTGRR